MKSKCRIVSINRFRYHNLLTPFIFDKVQQEWMLREKVTIMSTTIHGTIFETQSGYQTEVGSCNCSFFVSMKLPCKHVFKVREITGDEMYVPQLCSHRPSNISMNRNRRCQLMTQFKVRNQFTFILSEFQVKLISTRKYQQFRKMCAIWLPACRLVSSNILWRRCKM